jgi:tetratricopeptide (TPR) repeat protein
VDRKSQLLNLIQRAYEQEQAFVAALTDAERSASGTLERWSAKDLMAHVAEWNDWLAQGLAAAARGETRSELEGFDEVNAQIFERHRHRPWSDVLERVHRVQALLVEQVGALAEDDVDDTQRVPWGGRPLWRLAVGTCYTHPLADITEFYVERGDMGSATQIQEEMVQRLPALDDSSGWHGVVIYNLVCFHAISGQKEKAIAGLAEALSLNPDLVEWSKQDPDLDSIREEPAVQALYAL